MNHRNLSLLGALAFALAFAGTARAQSTQPDQPATPASTPATAPAAAPSAQPAVQDSAANSSAAADPSKAAAKKVWTNDDVGDLRANSAISTVGGKQPNQPKPGVKPATASRGKNAQWYSQQITRLQGQIPPIDQKIAALQDAISGKPVTEVRSFGGVRPDDWKDALARLQKQRADIEDKISSLRDDARHNGVPENQIP
jgi:hypothetical protein